MSVESPLGVNDRRLAVRNVGGAWRSALRFGRIDRSSQGCRCALGRIDRSVGRSPCALSRIDRSKLGSNGFGVVGPTRKEPVLDGFPRPLGLPDVGHRAGLFVYRTFRDRTDLRRRCRGHLRAVSRRLEGGRPSGGDGYPGRKLLGGRGPSARTTRGSGRGIGGLRADLRP